MKSALTVSVLLLAAAVSAQAQGTRIFRCGNTYTNDAAQAAAMGCKLVEGGNVTVVEGTRVNGNAGVGAVKVAVASPGAGGPGSAGAPRVDAGEQKARDSDARLILEAELKKAEARQSELLREYNNGEPEKMGPEHRNHQKYLDRVADMKSAIARNDNDISGIKRELSRLSGQPAASK